MKMFSHPALHDQVILAFFGCMSLACHE